MSKAEQAGATCVFVTLGCFGFGLVVATFAYAGLLLYLGTLFADVDCDKPLAPLLTMLGVGMFISNCGNVGFRQSVQYKENHGTDDCLLNCCKCINALIGIFTLVVFILGNVWVFSSDTCSASSSVHQVSCCEHAAVCTPHVGTRSVGRPSSVRALSDTSSFPRTRIRSFGAGVSTIGHFLPLFSPTRSLASCSLSRAVRHASCCAILHSVRSLV